MVIARSAKPARARDASSGTRRTVIARLSEFARGGRRTTRSISAKQAEYRASMARNYRSEHLRRKFGLTLDEYENLLRRQGGRCAVCGRRPGKASLHVDHDHKTGDIRGLLCFRCNGGLGQFKEQPARLLRAADYLTGDALPKREEQALLRKARQRARKLRVAS